MSAREQQTIKEYTLVNIRKLAALDIVFHGPRLILAEFAIAVMLGSALGGLQFFLFFHNPGHPLPVGFMGLFFSYMAINYIPLLLYAITLVRHKSAGREVAFELEHKETYARKYMLQSIYLLLPLIVPALAIFQEIHERSNRGH